MTARDIGVVDIADIDHALAGLDVHAFDQLIDHLAFVISDEQQVPGVVAAEHHLALAPEFFEELKDRLADLVVRRRLELGWVDSADDGGGVTPNGAMTWVATST